MAENDWIVFTDNIFDFECPPQGQQFTIRSKDGITNFTIRFDDFSNLAFRKSCKKWKSENIDFLLKRIKPAEKVHLLTVKGKFSTGKIKVQISDSDIQADSNNVHTNFKESVYIGNNKRSFLTFNLNGTITLGKNY